MAGAALVNVCMVAVYAGATRHLKGFAFFVHLMAISALDVTVRLANIVNLMRVHCGTVHIYQHGVLRQVHEHIVIVMAIRI